MQLSMHRLVAHRLGVQVQAFTLALTTGLGAPSHVAPLWPTPSCRAEAAAAAAAACGAAAGAAANSAAVAVGRDELRPLGCALTSCAMTGGSPGRTTRKRPRSSLGVCAAAAITSAVAAAR